MQGTFPGKSSEKNGKGETISGELHFFLEAWWAHTTGSLKLFFCWGGETAVVVALAKGFNVGRLPKA